MSQRSRVLPTKAQSALVHRLSYRLTAIGTDLEASLNAELPYPPSGFKQPRRPNLVGLFGPRGAGKTTTLLHVRQTLARDSRFLVPPLTDGSLSLANQPIGLSLLSRLRDGFTMRREQARRAGLGRCDNAALDHAWAAVERAYIRARTDARQLALRMAISAGQYVELAVREIRAGFGLPNHVAQWLKAEFESLDDGASIAVLMLDDADLMRGDLVAQFVWSMLDELHQPRLIVAFAADEERFERQFANVPLDVQRVHLTGLPQSGGTVPAMPLGMPTARDLLYKVLPSNCRFDAVRFSIDDRLGFQPDESAEKLSELLKRRQQVDRAVYRAVSGMLPPLPRGLQNIYAHLQDRGRADGASGTPPEVKRVLSSLPRGLQSMYAHPEEGGEAKSTRRSVLVVLAESRGEFALARQMRRLEPVRWLDFTHWGDAPLSSVAWSRLVRDARSRSTPMRALAPASEGETGLLDSIGDPLEASGWIELLVDDALGDGRLEPVDLVERVGPLAHRFGAAFAQIDVNDDLVESWIDETPRDEITAVLRLIHFPRPTVDGGHQERLSIQTGWVPFIRGLTGLRSLWPAATFRALSAVPLDLSAAAVRYGPDVSTGFVPRSLRALVRFADALNRQPWPVLSGSPLQWTPPSIAALGAGLIRAAYLRALGLSAERFEPTDPERVFFRADEAVPEQVTEAFSQLPPLPQDLLVLAKGIASGSEADEELRRALAEYCQHPVIVDLRERLNAGS